MDALRTHWDNAYTTKRPEETSWRQARPDVSLALIAQTGIGPDAAILDMGGGASTLADHLLAAGHRDVTVVDLSPVALDHARARLGAAGEEITWIAADATRWRPQRPYALWHDRAVLHFLTEADDQAAYAQTLRAALAPNGWAIIAGFAPGGPTRCSGLPIVQHDGKSLSRLLGADFVLTHEERETHRTPSGLSQAFAYFVFKRR